MTTTDSSISDRNRDTDIKRARELLDAYHDRELTDDEQRFVENALKEFPELTEESTMIVGIKNILMRYEGEETESDLTDKLLHRIHNENIRQSGKYPVWMILGIALIAAGVIVALLVKYL